MNYIERMLSVMMRGNIADREVPLKQLSALDKENLNPALPKPSVRSTN